MVQLRLPLRPRIVLAGYGVLALIARHLPGGLGTHEVDRTRDALLRLGLAGRSGHIEIGDIDRLPDQLMIVTTVARDDDRLRIEPYGT